MPSTFSKDITEAEFIKYLNDKTFVFNNLIITSLVLVRTRTSKGTKKMQFLFLLFFALTFLSEMKI